MGEVIITIFLLLITEVFGITSLNEIERGLLSSGTLAAETGNEVVVSRVIDGDTVELNTGEKVRYIGIDTPEINDSRENVSCFGRAAADKNRELVEGKTVVLQKDVSETDRYGRLLRYVYLDGVLVNKVLVEQGYARAATYPPDVAFQNEFETAQREAERENRGLWSACR